MMKKKMILFAGILAAFLMLAVPFAIVSFDADGTDASTEQSDIDWGAFEGGDSDVTITVTKDTVLSESVNISPGVRTLIIEEGVELTASSTTTDMFIISQSGVTFNIQNKGKIIGLSDPTNKTTIVWVQKDTTNTNISVKGGYYEGDRPFQINQATEMSIENVDMKCSTAGVWTGNAGVDNLILRNVNINSNYIGLYLGCQKKATLEEVEVTGEIVAIEIKSGNVTITDSSFTSSTFNVTNKAINSNGTGGPISTVFINNNYNHAASADRTFVNIGDDVKIVNDATGDDVRAVVVASGTNDGTVTLKWNGDSSEILTYYVPDVTPVKEIYINDYLVVKNVAELEAALQGGVSKIKLVSEFTSPETLKQLTISSSVEIDGSDVQLSNIRFNIGDNKVNVGEGAKQFSGIVTLKNLYITNANDSDNMHRAVSVMYSDDVELNIIGCKFNTKTYAVNITGQCGSIDVVIDDSVISGFCAIQTWAEYAEINVNNSILTGVNKWNEESGTFATIVVNKPYSNESVNHPIRADITLIDTTLNVYSTSDDNPAVQYAVHYRGSGDNGKHIGSEGRLMLDNCTINGLDDTTKSIEIDKQSAASVEIFDKLSLNFKPDEVAMSIGPGGMTLQGPIVSDKSVEIDTVGKITVLGNVTINGLMFTLLEDGVLELIDGAVFSGTVVNPDIGSIEFIEVKASGYGILIDADSDAISIELNTVTQGSMSVDGAVRLLGMIDMNGSLTVSNGQDEDSATAYIDGLEIADEASLDLEYIDVMIEKNGLHVDGSLIFSELELAEKDALIAFTSGVTIDGTIKAGDSHAEFESVVVYDYLNVSYGSLIISGSTTSGEVVFNGSNNVLGPGEYGGKYVVGDNASLKIEDDVVFLNGSTFEVKESATFSGTPELKAGSTFINGDVIKVITEDCMVDGNGEFYISVTILLKPEHARISETLIIAYVGKTYGEYLLSVDVTPNKNYEFIGWYNSMGVAIDASDLVINADNQVLTAKCVYIAPEEEPAVPVYPFAEEKEESVWDNPNLLFIIGCIGVVIALLVLATVIRKF